ncbi:FG-GAP-like repeat-containing protein, partial [Microbulbifer sp. TYP-18]|uniref:FG-GAP-like repeat-containing protein n=1 Tax=Microbulbifer sp. TYP-18 TaxID=3230024 RepID=UPI0034C5DE61
MRGCNDSGCGGWRYGGNSLTVRNKPGAPGTPNNPTSSSNGSYTISWAAASGIVTYYLLQESSNNGSSWTSHNTGTSRSFSVTAKPEGSYLYRVKACNTYSWSCATSGQKQTSVTFPAGPELSISPATSTDGTFRLSWNFGGAAQVRIVSSQAKNGSTVMCQGAVGGCNVGPFLRDGHISFFLQVQTPDGWEEFWGENTVSARIIYSPQKPDVTLVHGETDFSGYDWDGSYAFDVVPDLGDYVNHWEYQESTSGDFSTATTHTLTAFSGKPDGTYYYRIRGCNAFFDCDLSTWSDTQTVRVWKVPVPAPPVIRDLADSASGIYTIHWDHQPQQYLEPPYGRFTLKENNKIVLAGDESIGVTSFAVNKKPDGTYNYIVEACNPRACSGYSSAQVLDVANRPGPIAAISAAPLVSYDGSLDLIWSNPDNRVVEFHLEKGNYDPSSGTVIWTDTDVVTGQIVDPDTDDEALLSYLGQNNSTALSGLSDGYYQFRVWACNKQSDFETCNAPIESLPIRVANGQDPSPLPSGEAPAQINIPPATNADVVASDLVGETAGQFKVTEGGSAAYSIPILTGPASGSVAPRISLSYLGEGGNGPSGVGWNISGLSIITRCRMTREEDGLDSAVGLGPNDRFCLDGQRLIATSGDYGADGTEYRTAIDTFTQVRQFGDQYGPDYFEVRRKDGSVAYYGNSSDSYLNGKGSKSSHKLMWTQSSFSDNVGNTITYHYTKNTVVGEHLIDRIDYASNDGVAATNHIEFHYSSGRNDTSSGYWLGVPQSQTKRLDAIKSYSEGNELRTYKLGYILSASTGRSLLASVQECVGESCLAPTTFDWTQPPVGFGSRSPEYQDGNLDLTASFYAPRPADVNGDGREDLLWLRKDNDGDYFVSLARSLSHQGSYRLHYQNLGDIEIPKDSLGEPMSWHLLDYFGSGVLDLLVATDGNWQVYRYSGGGFTSTALDTGIPARGTTNSVLQDIDGDGLPDLVRLAPGLPGQTLPSLTIHRLQRNGSGGYKFSPSEEDFSLVFTDAPQQLGDIVGGDFWPKMRLGSTRLADFNGDGRVDLYARVHWMCTPVGKVDQICDSDDDTYLWMLFETSGSSFIETGYFDYEIVYAGSPNSSALIPADLNGDGLTDYLYKKLTQGDWRAKINTGSEFVSAGFTIPDGQPVAFTDYDGNGVLDMMAVDTTLAAPKMVRHYWDGNSFEREELFGAPGYNFSESPDRNYAHFFLDLEGDGFASHMRLSYSNTGEHGDVVVYHDSGNNLMPTDQITKITHGLGSVTDIHYRRMTLPGQSTDHTYITGTGAAGLSFGNGSGVMDLLTPSFLVSRVDSSAPTTADASHQVSVYYKYEAARIQAGGRGALGFEKVSTIDVQTGVVTTTVYRQDYPYTGMPVSTATCLEPTDLVSCEINDPSSKLISTAVNQLDSFAPVPGTVLPYVRTVTETGYTLGLEKMQKTVTTTTYDSGADRKYGNVSLLQVQKYDALDRLLSSQTTDNTYNNNPGPWHLGRLMRTEVTTARPLSGIPAQTRIAAFTYDPETGLLMSEAVEPDDPGLSMMTRYGYDKFGNKVSASRSAPGEQERISKWHYDSAGRYLVAQENALGQITSYASDFNHYGKAQVVTDINGVRAGTAYSAFGKPYFNWAETGAFTKKLSIPCPAGGCSDGPAAAAYKITTSTFDSSGSVEYYDKLGRQLRSGHTGFEGSWVFEDKEYDELGRVERQSLPYFSGDTAVWSGFDYDILGRTTHTDVPGNQCDITVTFDQLQGDGTVRTSSATSGGSGCNQTSHQDHNVLGELVKVTDIDGNTVAYGYDTQGNLTHTTTVDTQQGIPIKIQVEYDKLGRKNSMVDPDKGQWQYQYNGFGELWRQTDAIGNIQEMHHDALGRIVYREDRTADGSLEKASRWYYDRDPDCSKVSYAAGKLVFVAESSAPIASDCSVDFGQYSYAKLFDYDFYARLAETVTILGDAGVDGDHWEKREYDRYGRIKLSYDAANEMAAVDGSYTRGSWNHYHPQWGYITQVTSPDYVAGTAGQRYYLLQGM